MINILVKVQRSFPRILYICNKNLRLLNRGEDQLISIPKILDLIEYVFLRIGMSHVVEDEKIRCASRNSVRVDLSARCESQHSLLQAISGIRVCEVLLR